MHCLNCGGTLDANRHCQPCITRKATTDPKKWVASLSGHLHCNDCNVGIPSGTVRCMPCRKKFAASTDPEAYGWIRCPVCHCHYGREQTDCPTGNHVDQVGSPIDAKQAPDSSVTDGGGS